jgi:hypothetical protein
MVDASVCNLDSGDSYHGVHCVHLGATPTCKDSLKASAASLSLFLLPVPIAGDGLQEKDPEFECKRAWHGSTHVRTALLKSHACDSLNENVEFCSV